MRATKIRGLFDLSGDVVDRTSLFSLPSRLMTQRRREFSMREGDSRMSRRRPAPCRLRYTNPENALDVGTRGDLTNIDAEGIKSFFSAAQRLDQPGIDIAIFVRHDESEPRFGEHIGEP